ncbi:hypothetical protein amb2187 [Paramagnetospirillum magneticum AMB-1]|uniref:Uncharacterized protein n=1 Tax=Paramagnetospirillum magneticum (strain ATCC 700264 / AMB-1) TaxID=342108 RepID=Q2W584_PARM1|nr:hypothetical protein amb2187 [Paramagnetospirillum magneticum AMB-1]
MHVNRLIKYGWQGKAECRTTSNSRFNPDSASVSGDDPLANCKANATPRILIPRVKAAENFEDILSGIGNADAVIAYGYPPIAVLLFRIDSDQRWAVSVTELDGIADQILKNLHDLHGISHYLRQVTNHNFGTAFLYGFL